MRVLLDGQTVGDWANQQVAEKRLGVKLAGVRRHAGKWSHVDATTRPPPRRGSRRATGSARRAARTTASPRRWRRSPTRRPRRSRSSARRRRRRRRRDGEPPAAAGALALLRNVAARVSPRPVWAIAPIFAVLIVMATVGNVLKFFQEYLSDKAAILAVNDIRRRLYDHVLHVPMSHFGTRGHQRRHQPARAGLAARWRAGFKTVLGPEHPGADQGGAWRSALALCVELEADAVHRGLRAGDGR